MTDHVLTFGAIARVWNIVFHAPDLPVTLAVFRILFGMLLVAESGGLLVHGPNVFGATGFVLPESGSSLRKMNLFTFCRGSGPWVRFVFAVHFACCGLLMIGLFTRIAAFLIFLNFASRSKQNWYATQGGDNLVKFVSLLLAFSNAGALYSLDSRLGFSWAGGAAAPASQWPQRLMQIQVSIVYLRTLSLKLKSSEWINGTAVFYALYGNPHYRWHTFPRWLFLGPVIAFFTWVTLLSEGAAGTLIWIRETRYFAMAAIATVHLVIETFLRLKYFQLLMLTCLLLFVPCDTWLSIFHKVGQIRHG